MAATRKSNKQNGAGASNGRKRMSQAEVVNHISEKFDFKRAQAKEFFTELSELASKEVKKNGEFVLPGFGKLVMVKRAARETIKIPAKTTLKFRIGKAMKDSAGLAKKK